MYGPKCAPNATSRSSGAWRRSGAQGAKGSNRSETAAPRRGTAAGYKRKPEPALGMTLVLRSRAQTVACVIAIASLLAIGFIPLFGGPGYEIALAAGLI